MANLDGGNAVSNLNVNPDITAAWNSAAMKQLRTNMLKGKESSICLNCYEYERVGKISERMQYNKDYKRDFFRVLDTDRSGGVGELGIPLIDIRFSNRCNYKCRICSSEYSSLWHEDELRLNPMATPFPKRLKVATDESEFWKSFEKLLPNVRRLHFAGGEPLVMEEHYRTLEYLIAIGKTDLILSYNTNFSTLQHKGHHLVDLWNRFSKVDIWASLDGMGSKGDYQRKGQKWEQIEDNIRIVRQNCPNVIFGVNMTVSIFNILNVPDFYRHLVDNKLVNSDRMNLYLLFFPHEFCITNLTPSLKAKVHSTYEAFLSGYFSTVSNKGHFENHLQAILNRMDAEQGQLKDRFVQSVSTLDHLRGERFVDVFPELEEMLNDDVVL